RPGYLSSRSRWFDDGTDGTSPANSASGRQAHQVERRLSEEAIGVAEGFGQFEVVVVLADHEAHWVAGGVHRGGEFAVLTLKVGGLAGAVGDDQRRYQAAEMPDRAQCGDRRVVEFDVGI